MRRQHIFDRIVSRAFGVMGLSLSMFIFLLGCHGVSRESKISTTRMIPEPDFTIKFASTGGLADMFAAIEVKRGRDNPISIVARIGKSQTIRREYGLNDPVAKKVDAIIASGVFDLPSENRKARQWGRDLDQVKIEYRSSHFEKTIIRDYRWGKEFESSFHEADRLFLEVLDIVRNNSRPLTH